MEKIGTADLWRKFTEMADKLSPVKILWFEELYYCIELLIEDNPLIMLKSMTTMIG